LAPQPRGAGRRPEELALVRHQGGAIEEIAGKVRALAVLRAVG
jgi:hypothetical protein